jgi:HlyD family secretion protein
MTTTSTISPARVRSGLPQRTLWRGRALLALVIAVILTLGYGAYWVTVAGGDQQSIITQRPIVGEFIHEIVERGEIESSLNVELICEVAAPQGVRILDIVQEGTIVEAGDLVAQLDDSTIRKELATQKIAMNTVSAALSKAENDFAAAAIARKEYELGVFVQEEQKLESELFVAKENYRRAEDFYEHSRTLAKKSYITDVQLEGDRFSVDKHKKDLDAAETKLMVIREYTKPKTLKKHDSDIRTAEAAVEAEKSKLAIEEEKLQKLEKQVENCMIKAPSAGQIVYANQNLWPQHPYYIRKGGLVNERQVIVKLPDTSKMQVRAKISEARVNRVKPEMTVSITTEALKEHKLYGKVSTISAYAASNDWLSGNTKEYDAIVLINDPPITLRPGMSAKVKILIESQPDVLQVPVQAIVERDQKHYCIVKSPDGQLARRELVVGSTNEKHIIATSGLSERDEIVMNPKPHLAKVDLLANPNDTRLQKSAPESKQTGNDAAADKRPNSSRQAS